MIDIHSKKILIAGVIPDETTTLKFRHLLEEKKLTMKILSLVNVLLAQQEFLLKEEIIVGASLISAKTKKKSLNLK